MSVAKVTEIIAGSHNSFDEAIKNGIKRATETLHDVRGVWVESQRIELRDGQIHEYRVNLKVTFVLKD